MNDPNSLKKYDEYKENLAALQKLLGKEFRRFEVMVHLRFVQEKPYLCVQLKGQTFLISL